MHVHCLV